jgi:hypothetical protein
VGAPALTRAKGSSENSIMTNKLIQPFAIALCLVASTGCMESRYYCTLYDTDEGYSIGGYVVDAASSEDEAEDMCEEDPENDYWWLDCQGCHEDD